MEKFCCKIVKKQLDTVNKDHLTWHGLYQSKIFVEFFIEIYLFVGGIVNIKIFVTLRREKP